MAPWSAERRRRRFVADDGAALNEVRRLSHRTFSYTSLVDESDRDEDFDGRGEFGSNYDDPAVEEQWREASNASPDASG